MPPVAPQSPTATTSFGSGGAAVGSGAGSVGTPALMIRQAIFHMSEIVSGVAEVEGLVDQREVGNDVADHRVLDHRPVLPRRIVAMAAADGAGVVELERDEDFAAPAFDPAGADARFGG